MTIFPKKNKFDLDHQAISTLIGDSCTFEGNLKASAFVRIEGQILGDVMVQEGLIVGEKGLITGNVVTKEMIVYGSINGNINSHSLEIRSTGRITGDIKTELLQVETGGAHNGKLSMTVAESKPNNSTNNHTPKQIAAEIVSV